MARTRRRSSSRCCWRSASECAAVARPRGARPTAGAIDRSIRDDVAILLERVSGRLVAENEDELKAIARLVKARQRPTSTPFVTRRAQVARTEVDRESLLKLRKNAPDAKLIKALLAPSLKFAASLSPLPG